MSSAGMVSLVALLGWLVLVIGAFRTHQVGGRKALVMALVWGAIFLLAVAVFASISREPLA